jgi:hypothetical protein
MIDVGAKHWDRQSGHAIALPQCFAPTNPFMRKFDLEDWVGDSTYPIFRVNK